MSFCPSIMARVKQVPHKTVFLIFLRRLTTHKAQMGFVKIKKVEHTYYEVLWLQNLCSLINIPLFYLPCCLAKKTVKETLLLIKGREKEKIMHKEKEERWNNKIWLYAVFFFIKLKAKSVAYFHLWIDINWILCFFSVKKPCAIAFSIFRFFFLLCMK